MQGLVKWFNETKGYGFIAPDQGGKDVFVHVSAVNKANLDTLATDQRVEFDLEKGKNGKECATNIRLV